MIIVNGKEYKTLNDEIYIGPKNSTSKKTVSKTFEDNGFVLNVTSGPEDLRVVWVLYYNGSFWPNLVMFSEEQTTVAFNTDGSCQSNQTSSPVTLGSGKNGGTFSSGGITYYYNGVDYNGSYRDNQFGWPVYTGTYQEVVDSYSGYADLGTTTGIVSSDEEVDTSNKVIEVYVNGIKVYPDSESNPRTVWWTADFSYVVDEGDTELCYMDAGGFHRTYLKASSGPAIFALVYIPSGKIHEVIGISPNSKDAAYKWPFHGPELTQITLSTGKAGTKYDGAPFKVSWYGGLYDNYGTPKDPVEWSYIPQMTIDVPMGDRQGVLDAIAEAAGLQVSFVEVDGWYKSTID